MLNEQADRYFEHMLDEHEQASIPFETATGDLKGLDPDRSYSLSDPLEVSDVPSVSHQAPISLCVPFE